MLNPFKKKDDGFRLDDISLPSLNDNYNSSYSMPKMNSYEDNLVQELPELPSLENNQSQETTSYQIPSNDLGRPSANNPMLNPIQQSIQSEQTGNSNIHQEITKAQLETMMSKINLIDARQQNMEQKLEMIYQIILNEVSEDTKRKLNLQSMMSKIRQ